MTIKIKILLFFFLRFFRIDRKTKTYIKEAKAALLKNQTNQSLPDFLRTMRFSLLLSIETVAKLSNLAYNELIELETGIRPPKRQEIEILAFLYGINKFILIKKSCMHFYGVQKNESRK